MRTWLDQFSERLAHEREGLAELGFRVDETALREQQRLIAAGSIRVDDEVIGLTIVYPDSYPFLRPEVFATSGTLQRHQNPYEGNLCLLDRGTANWRVDDDGPWLLRERVPHLVRLVRAGGAELAAAEAAQGEPQSTYFRAEEGGVVFVGETPLNLDPAWRSGTMEIGVGLPEAAPRPFRGYLRKVAAKDPNGRKITIAEGDDSLAERFGLREIEGRWVRLDELPVGNRPLDLLAAARRVDPTIDRLRLHSVGSQQVAVIGFVFPEEVGQGEMQDGWLFLIRRRQGGAKQGREKLTIARGERLSRFDLLQRVPAVAPLASRKVAVVGLGAVGAPIALELARCGVGELRLLDGDSVEAGNSVRWPLGLTAVGYNKASVVHGMIHQNWPYTDVVGLTLRIGSVAAPGDHEQPRRSSELDDLHELLDGVDLIVDATAEPALGHLLSVVAPTTPQIVVWATEGAAGGAVVRLRPRAGACWMCLQHAIDNRLIDPPADVTATVQPRGCSTRTFTGASFDLQTIATQAARAAVAHLLDEMSEADDAQVCSLVIDGRRLPAPQWTVQPLSRHLACAVCSAALAA